MKKVSVIAVSIIIIFLTVSGLLVYLFKTTSTTNFSDVTAKGCTIFTVSDGEKNFFAGNEDYRKEGRPIIVGITPPTGSDYGSVRLGFQNGDARNYEMAMNDQGLAWDINSIPDTTLNRYPGRPYSGWGAFLSTITTKASTVEDAIQILQMFDVGDSLGKCQLHIADATGDAVVIGPGPDGEIAFTRKQSEDAYLISTNFNRAIPSDANHPETYLRYDNAATMLGNISNGQPLTADYLGSVLDASHFESLITYTLYSFVFDTKAKIAYIYYLSDFSEAVTINFTDAFSGGQRWFPISDLISEQVKNDAESKYSAVAVRDVLTIVIILFAVIVALIILLTILVRLIRRLKHGNKVPLLTLPSYAILTLVISCGCLSILLFISHIYPPHIISILQPESLYNLSIILTILGIFGIFGTVFIFWLYLKRNGNLKDSRSGEKFKITHIIFGCLTIAATVYLLPQLVSLFLMLA